MTIDICNINLKTQSLQLQDLQSRLFDVIKHIDDKIKEKGYFKFYQI